MKFSINGREVEADPEPEISLLFFLRDQLGMTGTKYGCGEGECGACTVLIDGLPKRSCRIKTSELQGKQLTTIEGIGTPEKLHPIQSAFIKHQAFQCGYCTSGMIVATAGLLGKKPNPTGEEIVDALNGNVCRCGTHPRVIAAVLDAAKSSAATAEVKG
jgi:aerobic-type carbon monoxide dehydrogenase small subunit (CoxS/CutS family)